MTTNRDLEHEPVRQHMPPNVRLTEDVSALEMREGAVEVTARHQLSGEPYFLSESILVGRVHVQTTPAFHPGG
jgi:hypothetical protein